MTRMKRVGLDALLGIERERAKRRQAEQARQNQPQAKKPDGKHGQNVEPVTQSEKKIRTPQSREIVGDKVGVSGVMWGKENESVTRGEKR